MSFGTFTGAFQVRFSPGFSVPKMNSRRSSSGSSLSVQARIRDSGSLPLFSTVTSRSKVSPGASRLSGPGRSEATSCGAFGVGPGVQSTPSAAMAVLIRSASWSPRSLR